LRAVLPDALEDAGEAIYLLARVALQRAAKHLCEIEVHIAWCDECIARHGRDDAQVRQGAQLIG
jgi:hypothetical protein